MNTTTSTPPIKETVDALGDLLREGVRLGMDMFDTLTRSQPSAAFERVMRAASPVLSRAGGCGCHIPPPCWMPKSLGEVVSHVCPGGTATLRIRVTNCFIAQREVRIEIPDKNANVKIEPPVLNLGPMERGTSVLSVSVPADAGAGTEREFLIWVSGCLNHYLRWTVRVAKRGADCCHEVEVEDCQDYVHHWYDHFYCLRPCQPRIQHRT
jgi:hypothetical protein